mgnify:CR=1 FL=1
MASFFDKVSKSLRGVKDTATSYLRGAGVLPMMNPSASSGDFIVNGRQVGKPTPQIATQLQSEVSRNIPSPKITPTPTRMVTPTQAPVVKQAPAVVQQTSTRSIARNPNVTRFSVTPDVETALIEQAKNYNITPEILGDIALQESSFNPKADAYASGWDGKTIDPNTGKPRDMSTSKGLFMFNDEAWGPTRAYFQKNPESSLRMPSEDRLDPQASAAYAAYLISRGQLGRWYPSANVWAPNYTWEELQPYLTQTKDKKALEIIKQYAKK